MATISENITTLTQIKADIKEAIINKGVEAGDDITLYGDKIRDIQGSGDDIDYLCFEAIEDSAVSMSIFGDIAPNIEYSFDKANWNVWDYDNIDILAGLKVYWRGDNSEGLHPWNDRYVLIVLSGLFNMSGNIMTLLKKDGAMNFVPYKAFAYLFNGSFTEQLTINDVSNLKLPATELGYGCYTGLFLYLTKIKYSPALPATELGGGCYLNMFRGCSSLVEAPYLPAKTLVKDIDPDGGTTARGCYFNMFALCRALQYIKADFTTTPTSGSGGVTENWVTTVASTGCFIKAKDAAWTTKGTYACPSGWTLITSAS